MAKVKMLGIWFDGILGEITDSGVNHYPGGVELVRDLAREYNVRVLVPDGCSAAVGQEIYNVLGSAYLVDRVKKYELFVAPFALGDEIVDCANSPAQFKRIASEIRDILGEPSKPKQPEDFERVPRLDGTAAEIRAKCLQLADFLIQKNHSYGDSALNPLCIFGKGDALHNLNARIDDKLARLMHDPKAFAEDPAFDLQGYLVLRSIAMDRKAAEQTADRR